MNNERLLHSWKFASNAEWEKALSVDVKSIDLDLIQSWILNAPQNVAFEAIFAENGTPTTMFGIRITGLPKNVQVQRIAEIASKTSTIQTEDDFKLLAKNVFPEYTLFQGDLVALNIGIVSQWYSFRPETIWTPNMPCPLSIQDLNSKAPRFFNPTPNPAAIEFWYTQPTDHWYKMYVSDVDDSGQYQINADRYQKAIEQLDCFR